MKLKGLFLIGLFTVGLMSFTSSSNLQKIEKPSTPGCEGGTMVCCANTNEKYS